MRITLRKRRSVAALVFLSVLAGWCRPAGAQTPAVPAKVVIIPDATPIRMRFMQPVWAPTLKIAAQPHHEAQKGDIVRLVAASDVKIGTLVVVARGAPAQATITSARVALKGAGSYKYFAPEIYLRLDWVRSVIGADILLRSSAKGKSGAFLAQVMATGAGVEVGRNKLWNSLTKPLKQKQDIPTGARIVAYVDRDALLDVTRVEQAQADLPLPNSTAVLTVYRQKGHREDSPALYCDEKKIGALGELQYLSLELTPGKHILRAGGPMEITVAAGQEYFVRVDWRTFSGKWELKVVENAEGEDAVGAAEPASK